MAHEEDLVVVHTAASRGEAEIVRALLEGAGLFAMVADANSPLPSIDLTPLDGEYRGVGCEVLVAAKDREEAERIIAQARAAGLSDEDAAGEEPEAESP
ncbi:MAG: putative signal transducing protein [Planctomycetota bacterium]